MVLPATNTFYDASTAGAPARFARAVTKSDTVNLPDGTCRALYVGVTGDVAVILAGDTAAVTFVACPVGYHPLQVSRVMSTGTTATSIVALY